MPSPTREERRQQQRREDMVRRQLEARGVADRRVLEAMGSVPRERFVAPADRGRAYADGALPIEAGQTISQPFVVAAMIEAMELRPGDHVLDVGAGSGYTTAVLARLAARVDAIERHPRLAALASARLESLGATNATVRCADGSGGWPERAPYDAILVSAGAPSVPARLPEQLTVGGRLVIPVGSRADQQLVRVRRLPGDQFHEESLGRVRFVPLVGAEGWPDDAHGAVDGGRSG